MRGSSPRMTRLIRFDPVTGAVLAALALLLGLFVLYPLAALLMRAFVPDGQLTLAPIAAVFAQPHHRAAFLNSLWLATLVGVAGTALGFLFALTATRAGLSERWVRLLDLAT